MAAAPSAVREPEVNTPAMASVTPTLPASTDHGRGKVRASSTVPGTHKAATMPRTLASPSVPLARFMCGHR